MSVAMLRRELERFDLTVPTDRAETPPATWHVSPEVHDLELRGVLAPSWQLVGPASWLVQLEDVSVCESVQRGLRSSFYDTSRYAPRLEHGMHHFHRLLGADLRAALAKQAEPS